MMPIRKMMIKQFRGLRDQELDFEGRAINAIIGQNASMKTTILGMIASSFALKSSAMAEESMIDGNDYGIKLSEKFKFSEEFDAPGMHEWSLELSKRLSDKIFTLKSYKRPSGNLRFWIPGSREKGDTLIQCPAIYLSLKRLSPIGEEKTIQKLTENMTQEEKELYRDWHNEILISTDYISDTSILSTTTKTTIAPRTDYYDGVAISAGQDNIGKIILAILSLRRLKNKYSNDYHGSIVCIDELESTLYPASQVKIIQFLRRISQEYSIQFFFTTHSMSIIRALYDDQMKPFISLNYAKKIGMEVRIFHGIDLKQIENDLYVLNTFPRKDERVKVYCEDEVGTAFTKYLVGKSYTQKEHLSYENSHGANIGYTTYVYLLEHKIPEFLNSIIVLDGDVRKQVKDMKKLRKYRNVVFLPTDDYPEKIVYDYLKSLPANDSFWENTPGGYTKQACFRDYTNELLDQKEIKQWFKELEGKKGRGYRSFITRAFEEKDDEKQEFIKDFIAAFEYVRSRHF